VEIFNLCFFFSFIGEAERIQQCKGRVFALQDEPEVARVWLPNNDSPGLAMARAFGDFCLKDYGLISVPEISYRRLTEKDEFIILATDGVRTHGNHLRFLLKTLHEKDGLHRPKVLPSIAASTYFIFLKLGVHVGVGRSLEQGGR
jgi:hypothetical protein